MRGAESYSGLSSRSGLAGDHQLPQAAAFADDACRLASLELRKRVGRRPLVLPVIMEI